MKKSLLCFVIASLAMLFSTSMNAQVQTATLQHNNSLSVFQGSGAFKSAYDAADTGDTIFLSSGTFTLNSGSEFLFTKKSITIQGSGCVTDLSRNMSETYLNTNDKLYLGYHYTGWASNAATRCEGLTIEGVHISSILTRYTVDHLAIRHCLIDSLYGPNSYDGGFYNVSIEHSRIGSFISPNSYQNVNISNSYVGRFTAYTSYNTNSISCLNCYINNPIYFGISFLNNCIINGTKKPNVSCTAYNCVVSEGLLSDVLDQEGNYEVSDIPSLFVEDYTSYDNFYKLTDEAAATYLGQDGTQVGIYGSPRPFTLVPSYPRVVEKSIAGQTTTDGKLRVYVKAEAQKK